MDSRTQEQEIFQSSNQEQDSSNNQEQDNTKAPPTFSTYDRNKNTHIGNFWRKLTLFINDGYSVQFMTKAKYDNISYKTLIKYFIIAYVNNDPIIEEFVAKVNKKKRSNNYLKKKSKDLKEEKKIIHDFGLDEDDIEDIFDEIGKENPEI